MTLYLHGDKDGCEALYRLWETGDGFSVQARVPGITMLQSPVNQAPGRLAPGRSGAADEQVRA